MNNSYLTAGITLKQLFRLLRRNPFSANPKYLLRIFFLVQSAWWSTIFAFIDSKRYGKKLKETGKIPDPVFIIGHWRTGTTLLHKLMSLDPNFTAPSLFHVAVPDGFLSSYRFYRPVMNLMVSRKRPMDMMKMGIDEPQEDEYALYRMTGFSPLTTLIFPTRPGYFLLEWERWIPEKLEEKVAWQSAYRLFFTKLYFLTGRRVISKNPFNSMRINELRSIFPNAKFIHIYRNPVNVIPSTRNMFQIVRKQNTLNGNVADLPVEEICIVYDRVMRKLRTDFNEIPENDKYEIRFEELEKDPVETVRRLYYGLGFPFPDELKKRIQNYFEEVRGYRKNEFHLSDEEKKIIQTRLKDQMEYYHYI